MRLEIIRSCISMVGSIYVVIHLAVLKQPPGVFDYVAVAYTVSDLVWRYATWRFDERQKR